MTSHLTLWKKEAAEDLENERFGWMEFDKASGSRFLNTDKVEVFLNTLIDRIHAHTLEEVRGKIEKMELVALEQIGPNKHKGNGAESDFFKLGYNQALEEVRRVSLY